MRKILSVIILSLALAMQTSMFAQIKFGIKGGMNYSAASLDNSLDVTDKPGFFVGPTIKLGLPLIGLGIDASVLYEQNNFEAECPDLDGGLIYSTDFKHQLISIPVNLRYDSSIIPGIGIFAYAGPQIGFNIGDKYFQTNYSLWEAKDIEMSVNVGLGVTFLKRLQISAGYNFICGKSANMTINKMWADSNPEIYKVVGKGRANSWQIGIGYYF